MKIKALSLFFLSLFTFSQNSHSAAAKGADPEELLVPIAAICTAYAEDLSKTSGPSVYPYSKEIALKDGKKYRVSLSFGTEVTIMEPFKRESSSGPTLGQILGQFYNNLRVYKSYSPGATSWQWECGWDYRPSETSLEPSLQSFVAPSLKPSYRQTCSMMTESCLDSDDDTSKAPPPISWLTKFSLVLTKV